MAHIMCAHGIYALYACGTFLLSCPFTYIAMHSFMHALIDKRHMQSWLTILTWNAERAKENLPDPLMHAMNLSIVNNQYIRSYFNVQWMLA